MIDYKQLVQDIIDGNEDPLKGFAILKDIADDISKCLSEIEAYAMEEAQKMDKTFEKYGYRFTRRDGSSRCSYKGIEEWESKKSELSKIEAKYKAALKSSEMGITPVSEDGEEMQLPTLIHSKGSISIKPLNNV